MFPAMVLLGDRDLELSIWLQLARNAHGGWTLAAYSNHKNQEELEDIRVSEIAYPTIFSDAFH